LSRQSGRNQIIELLAKRDFETDAGNHAELRVESWELSVKDALPEPIWE
jgi:hypothetical protein